MRLTEVRALTFDVYGTLIDWESGIAQTLMPWVQRQGIPADRASLLASFARHERRHQAANPDAPYPEVLALVFTDIARDFGVRPTTAEADAFGGSVGDWPAFEDSAAALATLGQHYKLGVISNVDRASFTSSAKRLGIDFDIVVTAEDAGAYKPSPEPFQAAIEAMSELGVGVDQILHCAQSLFHDHVPAQKLGLNTCWIDRQNHAAGGTWGATPPPPGHPAPHLRYPDLASFAEDITAARAA